jgi:5-methylcytosine-specific restriction enzyme subunit McrC
VTQVTVREHARLTLDPVAPNLDHATIGQTALDYLCDLQARAGAGNSLLKLEGGRSVKLVNYVGVIETPCGTRIEILPKHADHDTDPATARRVLRRMLLDSLDLNPRATDEASIELHRLPLTEWVIRRFLKELDYLVKRGIRFDYVRVEEEQWFLRGQWDIVRQMRQPFGRDHIF